MRSGFCLKIADVFDKVASITFNFQYMKKFLALISLLALGLTGCEFMIDQAAVHNGLVEKMDAVLSAEEDFYNEYFGLTDGADSKPLVDSFGKFEAAAKDLDTYYTETKFHSSQKSFVDSYNADYKVFLEGYLAKAKEFVDKVAAEGYTFEKMEPFFKELDQLTVDFVDQHNKLIDVINAQATETPTDTDVSDVTETK